MGTRADFYIGRGESAEWLGSIAWDGYPDGIPNAVRNAATEPAFREAVKAMSEDREDWTAPEHGWPWPWDDSCTTDYAYAFDCGAVYASCFGDGWFPATADETPEEGEGVAVFPNMKARKNVTFGKRSGVIVVRARAEP